MKSNGLIKWLYPGLKLKRWGILGALGLIIIIIGFWNMINNQIAKDFTYASFRWLNAHLPNLSFYQGLACLLIGVFFIFWCFFMSLHQYMKMTYGKTGLEDYYHNASRSSGPKIVAIGGGTGLSVLLKGLKNYTSNITAAVTVGDDGGSSGRLRKEFGVLPVGDIRNCIVSLADNEQTMETLFNYRFQAGEGLSGHTLGNLLLLAMTNISENFQDAISKIDDVLHVTGKVLPITKVPLVLEANFKSGRTVRGESYISKIEEPIAKLNIFPSNAPILQEVEDEIMDADVVILGPGSLYTSVIPNLRVQGVVEAIKASKATVIYICNVVTQPGETLSYSASKHLKTLMEHSDMNLVDYIILNDNAVFSNKQSYSFVVNDEKEIYELGVKPIVNNIVDVNNPYRHDSDALAETIIQVLYHDNNFRKRRGLFKSFWDYQKYKSYFS